MAGGDGGKALAAIILAFLGGLAAVAVIDALSRPKCPVCRNQVPKGANPCPYCRTALKWTE
ncbi:MAG: zinc-ribbon domain-containing protein [Chloroflexi bacterium]|nr:zinc-ribbon domain-containing protein [Chloroflexota bacterium]